MKSGSDNFRESAVLDILIKLKQENINIILYEPFIKENFYDGISVIHNLDNFIEKSDLIIANRQSKELDSVIDKVYSRDLFGEN